MTLDIKRKESIDKEISRIRELRLDSEDTLKIMSDLISALLKLQNREDNEKLKNISHLLDVRRET